MAERDVAIPNWSDFTVRGDGRPFSTGPQQSPAIIKVKWVWSLVEPLGLDECAALTMTREICRAMGDFLGPIVLQARKKADHAASIKILKAVARDSTRLAEQLEKLDPKFLVAIEEGRHEPYDTTGYPRFDFLHLTKKLKRLGPAATRAGTAFSSRSRGAPPKTALDDTIATLLSTIEPRGLEVKLSNSGSATDVRRHVEGVGGQLMIEIFSTLYPPVGVPEIWGAVSRVRAKLHQPATNRRRVGKPKPVPGE